MSETFSAIDPAAMARARGLLKPPVRRERIWPVLTAAFVLAVSALAFATSMILAPALVTQHVARGTP